MLYAQNGSVQCELHGLCLLNRFGVDVPYGKHDFAWFLFMQNQAYGMVYQLFHTLFLLLIFDVWEVNVY